MGKEVNLVKGAHAVVAVHLSSVVLVQLLACSLFQDGGNISIPEFRHGHSRISYPSSVVLQRTALRFKFRSAPSSCTMICAWNLSWDK